MSLNLLLDQTRAQTCLLMLCLRYQSYCYCPPTCPTASLSFLFTHLRTADCLSTRRLRCGELLRRVTRCQHEERWS
ncbi:hypothetical protein QQF64_029335 [Cirrhinus molitorella]|uniref:Secreted protein n=1 Tax=Cirrhinus molitorella TaxID=172907 RepID=A0ABR3N9J4_9TELE